LWLGPGISGHLGGRIFRPDKRSGWDFETADKLLTLNRIEPTKLLEALPETLREHRPEILIFVVPDYGFRKPYQNERHDWTDLGRLALMFGAVPVFLDFHEAQGTQFARGAELGAYPLLTLKRKQNLEAGVLNYLDLVRKFVLGRDRHTANKEKKIGLTPEED